MDQTGGAWALLLIIEQLGEQGCLATSSEGGEAEDHTPDSFSPASVCVDDYDVISQEIQGSSGLCRVRLAADIKHKKSQERSRV